MAAQIHGRLQPRSPGSLLPAVHDPFHHSGKIFRSISGNGEAPFEYVRIGLCAHSNCEIFPLRRNGDGDDTTAFHFYRGFPSLSFNAVVAFGKFCRKSHTPLRSLEIDIVQPQRTVIGTRRVWRQRRGMQSQISGSLSLLRSTRAEQKQRHPKEQCPQVVHKLSYPKHMHDPDNKQQQYYIDTVSIAIPLFSGASSQSTGLILSLALLIQNALPARRRRSQGKTHHAWIFSVNASMLSSRRSIFRSMPVTIKMKNLISPALVGFKAN